MQQDASSDEISFSFDENQKVFALSIYVYNILSK